MADLGISAVACAIGAITCTTLDAALIAVQPGMTSTELQSVLGPPDYIHNKNFREAWQYCDTGLLTRDRGSYAIIWLVSGQVTGLKAYPNSIMGTCLEFIQAFRWEEVPGQAFGGYVERSEFGEEASFPPRRGPLK